MLNNSLESSYPPPSSGYQRPQLLVLQRRLAEPRRFIQVIAGPRQTGKTTLARQLVASLDSPSHYASADEPGLRDRAWLSQQWEVARLRERSLASGSVLILDEVQKLTGWAESVKRLWDEDSASGLDLKVVLLGSAPLLVQRGLGESLAGRFEVVRVSHWSYAEMRQAFGWTVDEFVFFGGYPGAAALTDDHERWSRYVLDALVEPTLARDVLLQSRVDKPALLRQLFALACRYTGQILSYQKILGQLQDAGNATTLAHYLELLAGAGLVTGLRKYSGEVVRQRASSPKLQVLNNALLSAHLGLSLAEARADSVLWGRLVESAVGGHLVNGLAGLPYEVSYWRDRHLEVDFIVHGGRHMVAIEVKSGRVRDDLPGMSTFASRYHATRQLLVGGDGLSVEEFLGTSPQALVA